MRIHLVPAFGRRRLKDLSPEDVTDAMNDWALAGASPIAIAYRVRVLRMALRRAMKARRIAYNAADLVDLPAWRPAEVTLPDEADVELLLRAAVGTRMEVPYAMAIGTGIRQGELLALRWRDVDFEAGVVNIRSSLVYGSELVGAPKTRAGRRTLPLPSWVRVILAKHRALPNAYLVPTSSGRPLEARNLLRRHYRLCDELGIPRCRWHDFRHYAATRVLERTGRLDSVKRFMGHAQLSTTVDTYGHLVIERDVAEALER